MDASQISHYSLSAPVFQHSSNLIGGRMVNNLVYDWSVVIYPDLLLVENEHYT